jgi:hypothetical protein
MPNEVDFLASNKSLDWVALNEHLAEVRPIFDTFCTRHSFKYMNRLALGRYPRIRIERTRATNIWFDLWMELDDNGNRIERFRRDRPYELGAGAYVDAQDGSKSGLRFSKVIACFSGLPFDQVGAVLLSELEKHLPTLECWDAQHLKENGLRIELRGENR